MSAPSDLSRLFAQLAFALRRSNAAVGCEDEDEEAAASMAEAAARVPSLVASLNPGPDAFSESRVLDAALSLMCFRSSQVYGSRVDTVMATVVSVLSSLIVCEVDRFKRVGTKNEGILRVGSPICLADRERLLDLCVDVLGSVDGHVLCQPLLLAALKVAVFASDCQSLFPLSAMYYERSETKNEHRSSVVSKLQALLPVEGAVNERDFLPRLLLWYLDPLLLKDTISEILREIIDRPFLFLKKEFHERTAWRMLILYLATSPTLFVETRALLHKWFLATGLASVYDLQIAIVSSLLDVLSRPMCWNLSKEFGMKLPFSHAYFPLGDSELLFALSGPISYGSFVNIVNLTEISHRTIGNNMNMALSSRKVENVSSIGCNSTWTMLMNFPIWFCFASVLIFFGEHFHGFFLTNFRSRMVTGGSKMPTMLELRHAAVRYLAFILSPLDQNDFVICFNLIKEISQSWVMKSTSDPVCHAFNSEATTKNAVGCDEKLRKPRVSSNQKFHITSDGHEGAAAETEIWLKEFSKCCEKFRVINVNAQSKVQMLENVNKRTGMLFERICLGVLMCCIDYLDEQECAFLLKYAATGEMPCLEDRQVRMSAASRNKKFCMPDHQSMSLSSSIKGVNLLFDVSDSLEEICSLICDSEYEVTHFTRVIKGKVSSYLLTCIRDIYMCIDANEDGGRNLMLKDLLNRLIRWQQQGTDVFEGCSAFNNIIDDIIGRIQYTPLKDGRSKMIGN